MKRIQTLRKAIKTKQIYYVVPSQSAWRYLQRTKVQTSKWVHISFPVIDFIKQLDCKLLIQVEVITVIIHNHVINCHLKTCSLFLVFILDLFTTEIYYRHRDMYYNAKWILLCLEVVSARSGRNLLLLLLSLLMWIFLRLA